MNAYHDDKNNQKREMREIIDTLLDLQAAYIRIADEKKLIPPEAVENLYEQDPDVIYLKNRLNRLTVYHTESDTSDEANLQQNLIDIMNSPLIDLSSSQPNRWISAYIDIPAESGAYLTKDTDDYMSVTEFSDDLYGLSHRCFSCYKNKKVSGWYKKNQDNSYSQVTDVVKWYSDPIIRY